MKADDVRIPRWLIRYLTRSSAQTIKRRLPTLVPLSVRSSDGLLRHELDALARFVGDAIDEKTASA
jgi:hypothetical protein